MAEEKTAAAQIQLGADQEEDVGQLSQGQLMVRRFMQSKLSVFGLAIVVLLYLIILFADFVAPYDYNLQFPDGIWAPPTKIRFQNGKLGVYGVMTVLNEDTFEWEFVEDSDVFYPIKFFIRS